MRKGKPMKNRSVESPGMRGENIIKSLNLNRRRCQSFCGLKSGFLFLFLLLGLTSFSLRASSLSLGLNASFFYPTEKIFRDIYQPGAQLGGEVVYSFWYNYGLFLRAQYFRQEGQLSFTRDKTTVQIMPIILGFRYHVTSRRLSGYLDLGLGLFHFEEKNPIGQASLNKLGYFLSGGLNVFLYQGIYLGCRLDYNYCRVKPFELEAQIGGLSLGINIGYRFQLTPEEETWVWQEIKEARKTRKYHP